MGVVDAILVKGSFTTLVVIDVFLLMFSYIPIFIAAIALRVREPNLPRPYRVPIPTWLLGLWVCSPIAIAVYALFTNGSDYLVGGLVGVVSGPIAYLLVKRFYRGTADDALEGSVPMPAVSSEARRAHLELYRTLATSLAIVAGIVAIALAFYIHSSHPWAVGGVWKIAGVAVSAQRLLAGLGVVMIVGGLLVQRTRTVGGILVAAAVVVALCLIYKHTDFRMTNVRVWAAPVVLAALSAVFAGLALKAEVEPVGREMVGTPLAPPPVEEPREPLVVGASPRSDPGSGVMAGRGRGGATAPPRPRLSWRGRPRPAPATQVSSRIVTGPSLTSVTCMRAPKTPVATGTPAARTAATKAS